MDPAELVDEAKAVLANNDHDGVYTVPAHGLYPHQWLWDSCFIAIGLCHYNVPRAQQEIMSLLAGQWANGMVPNMILNKDFTYRPDREFWRSYVSPYAPDHLATSGITQPPMIAEAVVRIGKMMPKAERRTWYQNVYPAILRYHQWLYDERDPNHSGLVLQIHPWETGLENTPPWLEELHQQRQPLWIRLVTLTRLDHIFTFLRRDVHFLGSAVEQRMSTVDVFTFYSLQRRLRRNSYDIKRILARPVVAIEDLTFNCILIRSNKHLKQIAKTIGKELPDELTVSMKQGEQALEQLWDEASEQYFSRNFATQQLLTIPSFAALMPLYAGSISKERATKLVKLLKSKHYTTDFPVPTVPLDSAYFNDHRYWQGPTWLNTNWLIVDGLERYGFKEEAAIIRKQSLAMVTQSGFYEYFSPHDGSPAGAPNFSWTAALVIDFANSRDASKPSSPDTA